MKEDCLVAVVRAKNYEQGEKVVDAIIAGGINFIELTMTMDDGDPVGFIKLMAEKYKNNDKVVIGAISVSSLYKPAEDYEALGRLVHKKALELSRLLGYLGKF